MKHDFGADRPLPDTRLGPDSFTDNKIKGNKGQGIAIWGDTETVTMTYTEPKRGQYEVFRPEIIKGPFYWHYRAANGEIIAPSETYTRKANALKAIRLLQASAGAPIVDLTQIRKAPRPAAKAPPRPVKASAKGKTRPGAQNRKERAK